MAEQISVSPSSQSKMPEARIGSGLIAIYVLAYLGIWMAALTPILVTLPIRVRQIDPQNYVINLSFVLAAGAFFAMVANPFFGRLSDRTTSRFGMRRPWLVGGAFLGIVGMLTIAVGDAIAAVAFGWCLTQVAVNILLAVTTAILPDQIPPSQRGRVSGYLAMCMSFGPIVGAYVAKNFLSTPLWAFLVPALIMAVTSLLLAIVLKDRRMDKRGLSPYRLRDFFQTFWIDWIRYPDFSLIWLSRFLRFFGQSFLLSYQVYYVSDHLGFVDGKISDIVVLATLISAVSGVIGANSTGFLSDYLRRRKAFVILGALICACGMFILAISRSLTLFYVACGLSGLGQGIFVAADFAVVTEVLPKADMDAAKNLGIFNIASALPQLLVPAFGPFVLAQGVGNNYFALFAVAGAASLIGAAVVPFVRKVR